MPDDRYVVIHEVHPTPVPKHIGWSVWDTENRKFVSAHLVEQEALDAAAAANASTRKDQT